MINGAVMPNTNSILPWKKVKEKINFYDLTPLGQNIDENGLVRFKISFNKKNSYFYCLYNSEFYRVHAFDLKDDLEWFTKTIEK